VALEAYLTVFAEEDALDRFEAFAALNGPAFYGLAPNAARVTYAERPRPAPARVAIGGEGEIAVLFEGGPLAWSEVAG